MPHSRLPLILSKSGIRHLLALIGKEPFIPYREILLIWVQDFESKKNSYTSTSYLQILDEIVPYLYEP
jgi:hypothetical protein